MKKNFSFIIKICMDTRFRGCDESLQDPSINFEFVSFGLGITSSAGVVHAVRQVSCHLEPSEKSLALNSSQVHNEKTKTPRLRSG